MESYSSTLIDGGYHICTPSGWRNLAGHYTDYHRLYFPRSGEASFSLGGRDWRLKPGRVYLLPGYQLSRFSCKQRMEVNWLHFRSDSIDMDAIVSQFKEGVCWPTKAWAYWKPVYLRLPELFKERPRPLVYRTQSMLTWLYSELIELSERQGRAEPGRVQPAHAVNEGIEYIHQHFLENPALKDIAASVHLSPIYFHRCFTRAFRLSPHAYLMRLRMHHAWDLLRSGVPVTEAARRLKFGTSFYFSRAFKRYFGTTPVQVRLGRVQTPPP